MHRRKTSAWVLSIAAMAMGLSMMSVLASGPTVQPIRPIMPQRAPLPVKEPDYTQWEAIRLQTEVETRFLNAVREFLGNEGVDPNTVNVEFHSMGNPALHGGGHWYALAEVYVDETPDGGLIKRLVFEPSFWLDPSKHRFAHHRWTKLMWHEIHHLKFFPGNLRRATDLAKEFPPANPQDEATWRQAWISFLEPSEEVAAERTSIERYTQAFGPLTDELLFDSRGDMRKYAALYKERLAALLQKARDPDRIREEFPSALPIDRDGNII